MEIVLDTCTTNKTNGSKYDSKIVLRGHHNRHHNAKLKMWTQKFDLIEKNVRYQNYLPAGPDIPHPNW
jgi:hypothetical protein